VPRLNLPQCITLAALAVQLVAWPLAFMFTRETSCWLDKGRQARAGESVEMDCDAWRDWVPFLDRSPKPQQPAEPRDEHLEARWNAPPDDPDMTITVPADDEPGEVVTFDLTSDAEDVAFSFTDTCVKGYNCADDVTPDEPRGVVLQHNIYRHNSFDAGTELWIELPQTDDGIYAEDGTRVDAEAPRCSRFEGKGGSCRWDAEAKQCQCAGWGVRWCASADGMSEDCK